MFFLECLRILIFLFFTEVLPQNVCSLPLIGAEVLMLKIEFKAVVLSNKSSLILNTLCSDQKTKLLMCTKITSEPDESEWRPDGV